MARVPGAELRLSADSLSQRGLELLADGDAVGAAESFRLAIAADAVHVEAHHGLVRALRDSDQLDDAVVAAKNLIVITPDDPLAHTSLSIALQKAGRVPEAESAAGRARILEWKQQLAEPENQLESGVAVVHRASRSEVL